MKKAGKARRALLFLAGVWIGTCMAGTPLAAREAFPLACGASAQEQQAPDVADTGDEACRRWVDAALSRLSLSERVGQLLVATLPARADKEQKRHVRDLMRRHKVGGVLFSEGGTPEEQAILTNLARKDAAIQPLVIFDGEWDLSMLLKEVPQFPRRAALECISDPELLEEHGRETSRELHQLGIDAVLSSDAGEFVKLFGPRRATLGVSGISLTEEAGMKKSAAPSPTATQALLEGSDLLLVHRDVAVAAAEVLEAVRAGTLSRELIEERCRKVLAYKYRLGLWKPQGKLQVSGMGFRIRTDEAQALAAKLRREAVTVVNNYFGILPLAPVEGGIALLSIGEAGADEPFVEALRKEADVTHFQLSWNAEAADRQAVAEKLAGYRRVVISLSGASYVGDSDAAFLAGLELRAPLVYVCFTPHQVAALLASALEKSSAVVLAHSDEPDVQRHAADLLFAKAAAHSRLSVNIGRAFPAGTGCTLEPGMLPESVIPEDYGMRSYVLQQIDGIARHGLEAGAYPGCRILVLKDGHAIYDKGFGRHSDKDSTEVHATDLFDLASLTKTSATLLAVMKLYDEGRLRLDDRASQYLPFLRNSNKKNITLRELLFHESGLPPYIRFYLEAIDPNSVHGPYSQSWVDEWHRTQVSEHSYYCSDFRFKKGLMAANRSSACSLHVADGMWLNNSFKQTIMQAMARCELESKRYVYSDLSFLLLQQVVETIVRMPLDSYLDKTFYGPMGLERTLFLPLRKYAKSEIMPTAANDFLRRQDLCGYVHDEAAAFLGGVAGNAGLFSTASELAAVYQMLLDGGVWKGQRYLSEATCRLFTTEKSRISRRGLGFDRPDVADVKRSPCAASAPEGVYGHTGFTGTCAWVDPGSRTVYVFLSNRLCPNVWNTKLGDMNIRTDIQELVFRSLMDK